MNSTHVFLKELTEKDEVEIVKFAKKLNPEKSDNELSQNLMDMFKLKNFHSFGLIQGDALIGICSGWITIRFYSGKQLEVDNFIIDTEIRSKGLGQEFLKLIEQWAKENSCKTIELNTYVQNSRSHKFYFNSGYSILGFHFQKAI